MDGILLVYIIASAQWVSPSVACGTTTRRGRAKIFRLLRVNVQSFADFWMRLSGTCTHTRFECVRFDTSRCTGAECARGWIVINHGTADAQAKCNCVQL